MSALVRLYPRAWRDRYGDELDDLIAARSVGIMGQLDGVRGAIDAHRHPEVVDPRVPDPSATAPVSRKRFEELRMARQFGLGTIIGALLWVTAGIVAANGPMVDGDEPYRDGAAAWPFLLGSMILLAVGLIGQVIRLPAQAIVARLGSFMAITAAPIWALAPWVAEFGIVVLAGLLLLGMSAWWRGSWSTTATLGILASISAGLILAVIPVMGLPAITRGLDVVAILVLAFLPIWLVVGGTLLSLPAVAEPDLVGQGPSGHISAP